MSEEPDIAESMLDKAILARRDREFNEAWSDIGHGEMPEDVKTILTALCRDALSEDSNISSEWYTHYLNLGVAIENHVMESERITLWLLIRCLAVVAGTTGFKVGVASATTVLEDKKVE